MTYRYITTTLPYVNAEPHVGFAMELVRADTVARFWKQQGDTVFFNTGTDEHGVKIYEKAREKGMDPKAYCDSYAAQFKALIPLLGISPDITFIRTTDEKHHHAAQALWNRVAQNGYIYKKNYQAKYCIGCELEKSDSELVHGNCPLHPTTPLTLIDEENYFFAFSKFQDALRTHYATHPDFVIPDFRLREIAYFVDGGLQDFSISRLREKMPWGIPVPGDDAHVMYVWFDALTNYIATLGWPDDQQTVEQYWNGTAVQYCGKDNLRQQAAMWQAMLLAANLPLSGHIIVNGFFTAEGGVKMSKSLGNTIAPHELIDTYGTDAFRFFVIAETSLFEDSPFTRERFHAAYTAQLVNGIGNLTSRIMKLATTYQVMPVLHTPEPIYTDAFASFDIRSALLSVLDRAHALDKQIQETKPFSVIKEHPEQGVAMIAELVQSLYDIAVLLAPFLPDTSAQMCSIIRDHTMPAAPLFPRIEYAVL